MIIALTIISVIVVLILAYVLIRYVAKQSMNSTNEIFEEELKKREYESKSKK